MELPPRHTQSFSIQYQWIFRPWRDLFRKRRRHPANAGKRSEYVLACDAASVRIYRNTYLAHPYMISLSRVFRWSPGSQEQAKAGRGLGSQSPGTQLGTPNTDSSAFIAPPSVARTARICAMSDTFHKVPALRNLITFVHLHCYRRRPPLNPPIRAFATTKTSSTSPHGSRAAVVLVILIREQVCSLITLSLKHKHRKHSLGRAHFHHVAHSHLPTSATQVQATSEITRCPA